ncbi:zinc finger protein 622-like [Vespa mandarinia]|uniref:zinc finger protein 622-like n=1 Tax=Vespa mandarinia TaxID=7446 RepID=UPI0016092DA8|nr:zinc finger protein 622-like [Vespa mandarinia]XP_035740311.1 zinc finger protein 622-like [Vespa mandarinia]
MSLPFTCITCRVAFKDLEIQRQHYKSDWHRYNLKRKVADLPPVTVEDFQKRVIAQRNQNDKSLEENMYCGVCGKTFSTKNQYVNHLSSKKHREKLLKLDIPYSGSEDESTVDDSALSASVISSISNATTVKTAEIGNHSQRTVDDMDIDSDVESVDSDEWIEDTDNPIKNNNCLFCKNHSRSIVRNLRHMTMAHSFFIPDPEYCIDIKGLLTYLGEKIYANYMCIWCNDSGKAFQSVESVKAHMIDKGHCKMLHEGDALVEYAQFYDYSSSYPDVETSDPDAEVEIPELDDTDYQLVLPSGNVIGHRSLMRYYKQSLNPNRTVAISKNDKLRNIISQYKALGWIDTKKEIAVKKARDIKFMQRIQAKYTLKLNLKANKLQQHFRPQVNF